MSEQTIQELHEAIRQRDQLLNEASGLLAAGSGEDSPEYEEFLRLREQLPTVDRGRDLAHSVKMVRKKTKELRHWLRRTDRALGTMDPVDAIITFIEKKLQQYKHAPYHEFKVLSELIISLEKGEWVPDDEPTTFPCATCDKTFDSKDDLFQHCAHTTCQFEGP